MYYTMYMYMYMYVYIMCCLELSCRDQDSTEEKGGPLLLDWRVRPDMGCCELRNRAVHVHVHVHVAVMNMCIILCVCIIWYMCIYSSL